MKTLASCLALLIGASSLVEAQSSGAYTNFIRQIQQEVNGDDGVTWDMPNLAAVGESLSELPINPGGAYFELHTLDSVTGTGFLLRSVYVGAYIPVATLRVWSEDPYDIVPRTRADRPFYVDVKIDGLKDTADAPEAAKKVKFLHHVQSYGNGGTGVGLDRTQATLSEQNYIESMLANTLTYQITAVPGADRTKVRGEERFSVFSLADYQAPESELGSQFIQIWPVADGSLAGITNNQFIRYKMPMVTVTLNDLYPDSHTYVQAYEGAPQLGKTGKIVPGSSLVVSDTVPQSRILVLSDYDKVMEEDGQWTMELLTKTPFGVDRLAYVTFTVDRTIQMNGSVTTIAD